jgi:hypothetical protein
MKKSTAPMTPCGAGRSADRICIEAALRPGGESAWIERLTLPVFIVEPYGSTSGKSEKGNRVCKMFSLSMLFVVNKENSVRVKRMIFLSLGTAQRTSDIQKRETLLLVYLWMYIYEFS